MYLSEMYDVKFLNIIIIVTQILKGSSTYCELV